MSRIEMVEVFKEMLRLWELLKTTGGKPDFETRYCVAGFCHYIRSEEPSNSLSLINQLYKDYLRKRSSCAFWYYCYYTASHYFRYSRWDIVIENQIQPRIDHLKRTIARLEKEIKNEKLKP